MSSASNNISSSSCLWVFFGALPLFLVLASGLRANPSSPSDPAEYPRIPTSALVNYEVSTYEETVETMIMERVWLKGPKDILFDPVPNMKTTTNQPGKVRFFNRSSPLLTFEFLTFPSAAFPWKVTPPTLNSYLQGKALTLAESNFEVIEAPEITTGPAKFRILGQRALTIRYSFDTKQGKIIRGENWLEKDGMIHVVIVEGTPNGFSRHFKEVKACLNSMHYRNN
ncbi:MAG: hypothetical protein ACPGSB_06720 [Opitutales bacterium]